MIVVEAFRNREVAVFGLARSGIAAARALIAGGATVYAWDDNADSRARAEAAGVPCDDINRRDWRNFAALVLSPGIPLQYPRAHRVVEMAEGLGLPIIGDIELFALAAAAQSPNRIPKVVGITGTNGKSTSTALIGHILRESGRDVRIGGNIGVGVLDLPEITPGAHFVLELSSYQLDLVKTLKLDAACLINLSPDHLDRHGDMAAYARAKRHIFDNQGKDDWAIVGTDDPWSEGIFSSMNLTHTQELVPVSISKALGRGVSAIGGFLYDSLDGNSRQVADLAHALSLRGRHNHQNAAIAYAACRAVGVDERTIAQALYNFPGLEHRLENVTRLGRVKFVNDSKATNADATQHALAAFDRVYWILGGVEKAGGIDSLKPLFPRVAKAYLIGEAATTFSRVLGSDVPHEICKDMATAVSRAATDSAADASREPVVLLSPACASFDQYRDFEHRGDHFKSLVAELERKVRGT